MTARDKYLIKIKKIADRRDPYVWGGQGQLLRKTPLYKIAEMEKNQKDYLRVCNYIHSRVSLGADMKDCRIWDCSGLVTYLLMKLHVIGGDTTAQGLYNMYTRHISLDSISPGDLVFKGADVNHITHVGTYIGNNKIIEAKGRDDGVCYSLFVKSQWIAAGDPFDY